MPQRRQQQQPPQRFQVSGCRMYSYHHFTLPLRSHAAAQKAELETLRLKAELETLRLAKAAQEREWVQERLRYLQREQENGNLLKTALMKIEACSSLLECPICLDRNISHVFGCGHACCFECSQRFLTGGNCHTCRERVRARVPIFTLNDVGSALSQCSLLLSAGIEGCADGGGGSGGVGSASVTPPGGAGNGGRERSGSSSREVSEEELHEQDSDAGSMRGTRIRLARDNAPRGSSTCMTLCARPACTYLPIPTCTTFRNLGFTDERAHSCLPSWQDNQTLAHTLCMRAHTHTHTSTG